MTMFRKCAELAVVLGSIIIVLGSGIANAQDYRVGRGDLLSIMFWQDPTLNTIVRVEANGKVEVPVIGRIDAIGLTLNELSRRIVDRISIYNKKITQAMVTVSEYHSKVLYVTGHVGVPGKYSFETIPNIWQAILEAGGPLGTAQLDNITVIRGGETAGEPMTVNLVDYLEQGDLSGLPQLRPGDTITVPGTRDVAAGGAPGGSPIGRRRSVFIFGNVGLPGVYPYEEGLDVLQALVGAGGPLVTGDMSSVRVVSKGDRSVELVRLDLENYLNKAAPVPFHLRPGDTIFVPERKHVSPIVTRVAVEFVRITIAALTSALVFGILK